MYKDRFYILLSVTIAGCLFAALLSLCVGAVWLSPAELLSGTDGRTDFPLCQAAPDGSLSVSRSRAGSFRRGNSGSISQSSGFSGDYRGKRRSRTGRYDLLCVRSGFRLGSGRRRFSGSLDGGAGSSVDGTENRSFPFVGDFGRRGSKQLFDSRFRGDYNVVSGGRYVDCRL